MRNISNEQFDVKGLGNDHILFYCWMDVFRASRLFWEGNWGLYNHNLFGLILSVLKSI